MTGTADNLLEFKDRSSGALCKIELLNEVQLGEHMLDDLGFSGFGFVSTSIENDRSFLKSKRVCVTDIEEIIINQKGLKIFFAIGPSGEKVEVIGVA